MTKYRDAEYRNIVRIKTICLFLLLATAIYGQRREVHILAVNDMHAALEYMPRLAAIADSLRELYPSLLVLSAGDNRTGNPFNDMYKPSGYPMVALMNQIGVNASALGNHDFDMESLPGLIGLSNFRYLCANVSPLRVLPCQVFDVEGLRVGIIGIIQVNPQKGYPDTHPDNLEGLTFDDPLETVKRYEWLSHECDATILLSHNGYRNDTVTANVCPWLDLIIGGHSHKQLNGDERVNGILITQNTNKLKKATHITLTVDSGRVCDTKAEYIDVRNFSHENALVAGMVRFFSDNPDFRRVLAQAATPIDDIYEMGCLVCDAIMYETGAEMALHNHRGIRKENLPVGDITVKDVLTIDPFGNAAYVLTLTGDELFQLVKRYSRMEVSHFPHLGGLKAKVKLDKNDPLKITDFELRTPDGKRLDKKHTYHVATNAYVAAACKHYGITPERLNCETAALIMKYLEEQGTVSYQGVKRIEFR